MAAAMTKYLIAFSVVVLKYICKYVTSKLTATRCQGMLVVSDKSQAKDLQHFVVDLSALQYFAVLN